MRQIRSVMRFEFLTYAKSPTFIGMTIFLAALALIGPQIPNIMGIFDNVTGERNIAVVDNTGNFPGEVVEEFLAPRATFFTDINTAREAVASGAYNYALQIDDRHYTLYATSIGMGIWGLENQINAMLRRFYQFEAFDAAGLGWAQTSAILDFFPTSDVLTIGAAGEIVEGAADSFFENWIYSYVMSFVLYFGLIIGGQHLLTTVIREKSTKTMELLVTSCKASYMLIGKVLGVGTAVLLQILLMVGAAVLSMTIAGMGLFDAFGGGDVSFVVNLEFELLAFLVIFFLLGFVMYSFIYATLASTVSRMEDASSISALPLMLIMVGFFASVLGSQSPGSDFVLILSHVPLFAPFVMFMRIAMGTAATWEIIISIVAQLVTIAIIAFLGARIYRMGTLMYGNKPKLKDLLAAFK